jgi:hypothetical protein
MSAPRQSTRVASQGRRSSLRPGRWPAAAGVAYTTTWAAGLTIWPTNLDVRASDATVLVTYAGHALRASAQATLVHGIAALALAVVVVALARAGRAAGSSRAARTVSVAGLAAAGVSLAQWVIDLTLATMIAPAADAARSGAALEAINRLDGVKMLLLAALAAAGLTLARDGVLPRWLGVVGALLTVAISASGIGYLLLNPTFALLAYASGPLLLLWVTSVGLRLGRRSRPVGQSR